MALWPRWAPRKLPDPPQLVYCIQWMLFNIVRYPCCTNEFFEREVDLPTTPRDELSAYRSFSPKSMHFMAPTILVYSFYTAKTFYYAHYTMSRVDFAEPRNNIKRVAVAGVAPDVSSNSPAGAYQYGCLSSNCSRLSDEQPLELDLIKLPLFAICEQRVAEFFGPVVGAQSYAALQMSAQSVVYLILCILLPIFEYVAPFTPNSIVMFVLCPITQLRCSRKSLGRLVDRLACSWANFQREEPKQHQFRLPANNGEQLDRHGCDKNNAAPLAGPTKRAPNGKQLDTRQLSLQRDAYVEDCVPINQTEWWRRQWSVMFVKLCVLAALSYWILFLIMIGFLSQTGADYFEQNRALLDYATRLGNCSIWLTTSRRALRVDDYIVRPDWYNLLEPSLMSTIPLFVIAITFSNYMFVIFDEKICIIELDEQLNMAIEYCELVNGLRAPAGAGHHQRRLLTVAACGDGGPACAQLAFKQQKFSLSAVRRRLVDAIRFRWFLLIKRPLGERGQLAATKLEAHRANQRLALELLLNSLKRRQPIMGPLVELLEKLHINYWHFTSLLRTQDRDITNVLVCCYALNYSFAILAVYFYKKVNDFLVSPLVLIGISLCTANFFISVASSIHADLKKTERSFWTLIALNVNAREPRIRHLTHIWLRQFEQIDQLGGLAQQFYGINITYLGIIQLVLWTATILLFALNRR